MEELEENHQGHPPAGRLLSDASITLNRQLDMVSSSFTILTVHLLSVRGTDSSMNPGVQGDTAVLCQDTQKLWYNKVMTGCCWVKG